MIARLMKVPVLEWWYARRC